MMRSLVLGLLLSLGASCSRREEDPLSALLITLDTTRADAPGFAGIHPGLTPCLDALARESVVYERAHTVVPHTIPAHASILTGLYPLRHGVRTNGTGTLSSSAATLAEAARAAGIATGAFVASAVLDPVYGLDQGFERYDVPSASDGERSSEFHERPAREVVDAALAWLAEHEVDERFFLWVHLFDAHAPYVAPSAPSAPGASVPAAGDAEQAAYLSEVRSMDAEIARLLGALRADGRFERTIVLVVADHGEAFGEHAEITHGTLCYEPTLAVPFLLRDPSAARAGERSREIVSVVDVAPTLAEALAVELSGEIDGQSLFRRRVRPERGVYFENYHNWIARGASHLTGWLDAHGKYVHSSVPEFYDLERDPAEAEDLALRSGARLEPYRAALARIASLSTLAIGERGLDAEHERRLQALGYATIGSAGEDFPAPLAASDRPSPRALTEGFSWTTTAMMLVNRHQFTAATELLERALAEHPDNWQALETLGAALLKQDRCEEALVPLERLVKSQRARLGSYSALAVCYARTARHDAAIAMYAKLLEFEPENAAARAGLALVLRSAGRDAEARDVEGRGLPGLLR